MFGINKWFAAKSRRQPVRRTDLRLNKLEDKVVPAGAGYHVSAYYPEWGTYGRAYEIADVPAEKLTHLIYGFADLKSNGEVTPHDIGAALNPNNESWLPAGGNLGQLNLLKQQHPHLRTMIAIGGWTLSDYFSDAALTVSSRDNFATSAVNYMKTHNFDGIAIDWEFPVSGGLSDNKYRPEDKQNFTLMMQSLRGKMDSLEITTGKQYELTAAMGAGAVTQNNYEFSKVAQYVDWIDLMSYDYHGGWEQSTNHQAATKSPSSDPNHPEFKNNVSWSVDYYIAQGVPPEKISIGLPMYGRAWQGVPNVNHGLLQPASAQLPMGTWEAELPPSQWTGSLDYEDLYNRVHAPGSTYTEYWDSASGVPYIYSPTVNGGTFSSYENKTSVNLKLDQVISKGLAGGFFWEMSADLPATHADSLLKTTSDRMLAPTTKIQLMQVGDGSAQRSQVKSVTVTFSNPVTFTSTAAAAFQLTGPNGIMVNFTATQIAGNAVRLDFAPLADGNYSLTTYGSKVFDPIRRWVDGDNNNLPGGDKTFAFHRLFGDADGNRTVNATDFAAFRSVFGLGGTSIFDFNNDGQTNASDFAQFRGRFGLTI